MRVVPTNTLWVVCVACCRELVPTADISLVASLMQLLHSLLDEWRAADAAQAQVRYVCKQQPPATTDSIVVHRLACPNATQICGILYVWPSWIYQGTMPAARQ
jgi:hypothetical protein